MLPVPAHGQEICLLRCFDPIREPSVAPELAGQLPDLRAGATRALHLLVQRDALLDGSWIARVREAGGRPVGYIPQQAILVRVEPAALAAVAGVEGVRWVGEFRPAHRLSARAAAALTTGPPEGMAWPDGSVRLQAQLLPGEHPADYEGEFLALIPGATVVHRAAPGSPTYPWAEIVLQVEREHVLGAICVLASSSAVQHVDFYSLPAPRVDDSVWFLQTGIPDAGSPKNFDVTASAFAHGLTGLGELAGVADSGLQHRTCHFLYGDAPTNVTDSFQVSLVTPPAPLARDVTAPANKVVTYYSLGAHLGVDCDVHGTPVAGIMVGDDWACLSTRDSPFARGDCAPSLYGGAVQHHDLGDGLAPGAQLVFQGMSQTWDCGSSLPQTGTGGFQTQLHDQAYMTFVPGFVNSGVRVHNDSYGTVPVSQDYTTWEQAIDAFQWSHRDYLLTWPVMNRDAGPNTFANPEHFKNGLSVGASVHASVNGGSALGEDLAAFSAHGPAAGGRVKPDVVAPGQDLNGPGIIVVDPVLGTCGTLPGAQTGTSFAGPSVGGLALQVRQYFRRSYYPSGFGCTPEGIPESRFNPTNALVKAVLINSTRNMLGASTADDGRGGAREDRPTFGQGWGRPVLDDALFFPGPAGLSQSPGRTHLLVLTDTPNGYITGEMNGDRRHHIVEQLQPAIRTGDIADWLIEVKPGEDLHVTLAWSDPSPTAVSTSTPLVNDLDLELVGPDPAAPAQTVVWRPNPGTSSVPGADPMRVWQDGYTQLGPATCPPPGSWPATCDDVCPEGQPQHRFPQRFAPPFCPFDHRDARNNVENIFLPAASVVGGFYTVRVIGMDVPGNPLFTAVPAWPDWNVDDGPGVDYIDSDRPGYAVVVTGLVSGSRGAIHFDRASYQCGDLATVVVNDMTTTDIPVPVVDVTSPLGDSETFPLASGRTLPFRLAQARDPADFTAGDGVISFLPGQVISARYVDPTPFGHVARACAATGQFTLELQLVAVSDACGNRDALVQRDEVIRVDVTVTNLSDRPMPFLQGRLSTADPQVLILRSEVMFASLPVAAGGTATGRFALVVNAAHACPADVDLTLVLQTGSACAVERSFVLSLDPGCGAGGGVAAAPGEVPATSLRVSKLPPDGLRLDWAPALGADRHNVYRGDVGPLQALGAYSHVFSLAAGAGNCRSGNPYFEDSDDVARTGGNFYYLVSGTRDCGLEGPAGFDSFAVERPAGGGCP